MGAKEKPATPSVAALPGGAFRYAPGPGLTRADIPATVLTLACRGGRSVAGTDHRAERVELAACVADVGGEAAAELERLLKGGGAIRVAADGPDAWRVGPAGE